MRLRRPAPEARRPGRRCKPGAAAGLCAALLLPPAIPSASAQTLTVATWALYQDALRRLYFHPFAEATGIAVHDVARAPGIGQLRALAEGAASLGGPAPRLPWDLAEVEGDEALLGCGEGLFERIDWNRLGGKDHYLPAGVSDCGVGALAYDVILAWDRDKLPATPSWSDFWDIAKYPGKRGLRASPRTNLEIALLADGVAPGDVYSTLRSDAGVERAFRKLDQLKPYVVWWNAPEEPAKLLGSGEVLMTTSPNGPIVDADRDGGRHFGIQWNNSLAAVDFWAILKNSPNTDAAYSLLGFMGEPEREAQLEATIPYSGLAKGAGDKLSPEALENSPAAPAHQKAALPIDEAFWKDNLDRLTQRFNAWLAH